jgi:hypothetical protein
LVGNSDQIVGSIGADKNLINVFGAAKVKGQPLGIPVKVVGKNQKKFRVKFTYPFDSDRFRYPLPKSVAIKGGKKKNAGRQSVILNRSTCTVYELTGVYPTNKKGNKWAASVGAVWDLKTNTMRKRGIGSATRSGLPLLPGLVRYEEVAAGRIDHAIAVKVPSVRSDYLYPARKSISKIADGNLPAFGQRLRLKATYDTSAMTPQAKIVAQAMKEYGLIVYEVGTPWMFPGVPSSSWKDVDLNALKALKGGDFEVVDATTLPTPGI